MSFKTISKFLGAILILLSVALTLPLAWSVHFSEDKSIGAFLYTIAATLGVGVLLLILGPLTGISAASGKRSFLKHGRRAIRLVDRVHGPAGAPRSGHLRRGPDPQHLQVTPIDSRFVRTI